MQPKRTPRRPWRRNSDNEQAAEVFRELQRREMRNLETCRQVWEQEFDPIAVCEALRHSNIPEWLKSAALYLITDGEHAPAHRPKLWRDRSQRVTDSQRAALIAAARIQTDIPLTWEQAHEVGEFAARQHFKEMAPVSIAGAKRSYDRVRRELVLHPWRYYRQRRGFQERLMQAREYMLALMQASVESAKAAGPAREKK